MSLSREGLLQKNILYDPTPIEPGKLPQHVECLRESILDFSGLVPAESAAKGLESVEESLASSDALLKNPQIDSAENIRAEAERLRGGGFSEDHWVEFFLKNFFDPLGPNTVSSGQDART